MEEMNPYKIFRDITTGLMVVSLFFMSIFNVKLMVEAEDTNTDINPIKIMDVKLGLDIASVIKEASEYEPPIEVKETAIQPVELTPHERAGREWEVDPKLLEAIERLETGHYTSNLYLQNNNTWGARTNSGWLYFDSPEQSTMTLAKNLRLYYFNHGLTSVDTIAYKYCPDNPNTEKNEAAEWAWSVKSIYNTL